MANNVQYHNFVERERQNILADRNEESRVAVHNCQCILQGRQDYKAPGPLYFPANPLFARVISHIFDKEKDLRQPIEGGIDGGLQPDEENLLNLMDSQRAALINKIMLIIPQEWQPNYQRIFAEMQNARGDFE